MVSLTIASAAAPSPTSLAFPFPFAGEGEEAVAFLAIVAYERPLHDRERSLHQRWPLAMLLPWRAQTAWAAAWGSHAPLLAPHPFFHLAW